MTSVGIAIGCWPWSIKGHTHRWRQIHVSRLVFFSASLVYRAYFFRIHSQMISKEVSHLHKGVDISQTMAEQFIKIVIKVGTRIHYKHSHGHSDDCYWTIAIGLGSIQNSTSVQPFLTDYTLHSLRYAVHLLSCSSFFLVSKYRRWFVFQ